MVSQTRHRSRLNRYALILGVMSACLFLVFILFRYVHSIALSAEGSTEGAQTQSADSNPSSSPSAHGGSQARAKRLIASIIQHDELHSFDPTLTQDADSSPTIDGDTFDIDGVNDADRDGKDDGIDGALQALLDACQSCNGPIPSNASEFQRSSLDKVIAWPPARFGGNSGGGVPSGGGGGIGPASVSDTKFPPGLGPTPPGNGNENGGGNGNNSGGGNGNNNGGNNGGNNNGSGNDDNDGPHDNEYPRDSNPNDPPAGGPYDGPGDPNTPISVPEPSTLLLVGVGMSALTATKRKRS